MQGAARHACHRDSNFCEHLRVLTGGTPDWKNRCRHANVGNGQAMGARRQSKASTLSALVPQPESTQLALASVPPLHMCRLRFACAPSLINSQREGAARAFSASGVLEACKICKISGRRLTSSATRLLPSSDLLHFIPWACSLQNRAQRERACSARHRPNPFPCHTHAPLPRPRQHRSRHRGRSTHCCVSP